MSIKFSSLTFELKDLLLICGFVAGYFRFEQRQMDMYNELKNEMFKIVADNKLQEVKVNARFDAMLNKQTSHKETEEGDVINFVALIHENRLQIIKKRLVKFRLV